MMEQPMKTDPADMTAIEARRLIARRTLSPDPGSFTVLPRRDLSSLRITITEDYGFAMTESIIRRAFRKRAERLAPLFGRAEEMAAPDCTGADRIFAVLRAVMMLGAHYANTRKYPGKFGPNILANVDEGLSYSALDVAEAMNAQGVYYRNWQRFFETHDYILSPAVTISPRDWHELYPRRSTACRPRAITTGFPSPMPRRSRAIPRSRFRWAGTRPVCRSVCRSSAGAMTIWGCCPRRPKSRRSLPETPNSAYRRSIWPR
jgi:Asp-tRNA(Asn)/Glu-tRNA(Gln) amidotransferase A subunit family amidase